MSGSFCGITIAVGFTLFATVVSAQEVERAPANQPDAARLLVQQHVTTWQQPVPEQASADPNRAFSRALLGPGLGHFYCGETTRGAVLLGGAAGSLIAGFLLSGNGKYNAETHEYNRGRKPLAFGAAGAGALYVASLIDSRASCNRMNQRR